MSGRGVTQIVLTSAKEGQVSTTDAFHLQDAFKATGFDGKISLGPGNIATLSFDSERPDPELASTVFASAANGFKETRAAKMTSVQVKTTELSL